VIDAGAQFTLTNLTATGNTSDTIGIEGGVMTGAHTWPESGINTYDLHYGYVSVAPTGTLTIEPGVTVLFGVTRDITVRGTLTALGTSTDPILFTGETATPGSWAGLNFVGTAQQHAAGHLAYATVEYGGYGGAALVSLEYAFVTFTHCILRYCTSDAIEILPGWESATVLASPLASPAVQVSWSSLSNISGYAINNGLAESALAAYNWWGAASGPTASDNPDGTGSALNGPVLYRPYLIGPDGGFVFLPLVVK
jgi:hypothetical protein